MKRTSPSTVAFYHGDGLVPAWKQAQRFAGETGRVATIPDIISARLNTTLDDVPWTKYFTTRSAEYLGLSPGGNKVLVVAHGVGPMEDIDGALKAYKWHYADKTRQRSGGRIPREDFLKLLSGHFGQVSVVDFGAVLKWHQYPFDHLMGQHEARYNNPLVRARLGPDWSDYIEHHNKLAVEFLKSPGGGVTPTILGMSDPGNCSYEHVPLDDGQAVAHLLAIDAVQRWGLSRRDYPFTADYNLIGKIGCHEWWNSVRMVGTNNAGPVTDINPGVDNLYLMMGRHWRKLAVPVKNPVANVGFRALLQLDNLWFTQHPKSQDVMDTGEPEYFVKEIEQIPGPATFTTTPTASRVFLKYDIDEIRAIAPQGANAYHLGNGALGGEKGVIVPITFYKVKVDTSLRIRRSDDILNDYDLRMLITNEAA